jgi:hypothetical protein
MPEHQDRTLLDHRSNRRFIIHRMERNKGVGAIDGLLTARCTGGGTGDSNVLARSWYREAG